MRMRLVFVAGSRILIRVAADRSGSSVVHPCTFKVYSALVCRCQGSGMILDVCQSFTFTFPYRMRLSQALRISEKCDDINR
jgi:hypothetical protein